MTTKQQVLNIINSELCTEVGPEELLVNLPMDSLEYVDLIGILEVSSGKEAPATKHGNLNTVSDLMDFFGC